MNSLFSQVSFSLLHDTTVLSNLKKKLEWCLQLLLHLATERVSKPRDILHSHCFHSHTPPGSVALPPSRKGSHLCKACLSLAPGQPSGSNLFCSSTSSCTSRTLVRRKLDDISGFPLLISLAYHELRIRRKILSASVCSILSTLVRCMLAKCRSIYVSVALNNIQCSLLPSLG